METMTILGSGLSSVAGIDWFLIGYAGDDVFVAICDHSSDEIQVKSFTPGQKQLGDGSLVEGSPADEIKRFCKNRRPSIESNLNWDDRERASNLYWSYKEKNLARDNAL